VISKKVFEADGDVARYLSDFIIMSELFVRPYAFIYDDTLPPDGSGDRLQNGSYNPADWSYPGNLWMRGFNIPKNGDVVPGSYWDTVDNSVLFYEEPYKGTTIWIEVATTTEEFGDTLLPSTVEEAEEAARRAFYFALLAEDSANEARDSADRAEAAADGTEDFAERAEEAAERSENGAAYVRDRFDEEQGNGDTVVENINTVTTDPVARLLADARDNAWAAKLEREWSEAHKYT
jgi:hypothetical protein